MAQLPVERQQAARAAGRAPGQVAVCLGRDEVTLTVQPDDLVLRFDDPGAVGG